MKILHVETGRQLYGGPQQVIYLCNGLAGHGIDNVLVCPPASGLDRAARDAGIAVINVKCAGDHDLGFAFRLRQRLMVERPDIVHCHSRRGADFLGGLAATGTAIPAVISRRVDAAESPLIASLRYRPFRKVIAISEAIASILRESGVAEERLAVIRSAVDTERFMRAPDRQTFRAAFGLSHADTVAAVIAQLIPRKGHRYLLQAMAQLGSSHPALKLIVFGQGPLEAELRRLMLQLDLGGTVQFAGFRPDLDDYLPCLDLLVQPSLAEGLGVAAMKAAAAGIPVVGFAAGGLSEVVEDGTTGLLVRPKDVEGLRDAIATLCGNPALRRQFGAAGRRHMQSEFSISRMVAQHRQLYETVLHGAG